jgi:hypothetical protein
MLWCFCVNGLRWKLILHFVDIGRILLTITV